MPCLCDVTHPLRDYWEDRRDGTVSNLLVIRFCLMSHWSLYTIVPSLYHLDSSAMSSMAILSRPTQSQSGALGNVCWYCSQQAWKEKGQACMDMAGLLLGSCPLAKLTRVIPQCLNYQNRWQTAALPEARVSRRCHTDGGGAGRPQHPSPTEFFIGPKQTPGEDFLGILGPSGPW